VSTENERNAAGTPEENKSPKKPEIPEKITFLGHELVFGMPQWEEMDKTVCLYEDFGTKVMENPDRVVKCCRLLSILMRHEMTEEEIHERMTPPLFLRVPRLIQMTFAKGMKMENHENEGKIVDVTLEEIEKKEERGG